MNIQKTQNSASFKSVYPVYHWVRETNGSYAPAVTHELNEKLQKQVVRFLNGQVEKAVPRKQPIMNRVKQVVSAKDKDYAETPIARSFYNSNGGLEQDKFEPIGYILTGANAEQMSETLGKPIGKTKSETPKCKTAELNIVLGDYFKRGLTYVKKLAKKFKDDKNVCYGLHTKFEVVRSKTGKIKEYKLEDLRFCPEKGSENPFVKTGYIKN